jgi:transposase
MMNGESTCQTRSLGSEALKIYSIIESCRRNGVEPYTYLCDVLSRLPSMTNWQIKRNHSKSLG